MALTMAESEIVKKQLEIDHLQAKLNKSRAEYLNVLTTEEDELQGKRNELTKILET